MPNSKVVILTPQEQQEAKEFSEHSLVVSARIDSIVDLILMKPEILNQKKSGALIELVQKEILKKQNVSLSQRTIERYVKEAKKQITDIIRARKKKKVEESIDRHILYRYSIVHRAREAGDLSNERLTLIDIAELEGRYPEKNIKHSGEIALKNIDYSKLTKRQLQRLAAGESINAVLADSANDDRSTN